MFFIIPSIPLVIQNLLFVMLSFLLVILSPFSVILSGAKNLNKQNLPKQILRVAQDDDFCQNILFVLLRMTLVFN